MATHVTSTCCATCQRSCGTDDHNIFFNSWAVGSLGRGAPAALRGAATAASPPNAKCLRGPHQCAPTAAAPRKPRKCRLVTPPARAGARPVQSAVALPLHGARLMPAMAETWQTAWVTGASSGIGRALALALAKRGAKVAASARSADKLAELARLDARVAPFPLDVRD